MSPEIAVIVNSFNRLVLLKECLPNILNTLNRMNVSHVISIFDAGSSDGSVEYVSEMMSRNEGVIELITSRAEDHVSFSAGCNRSADTIMHRYPDVCYLLFFETDNLFRNEMPLQLAFSLMKEKKEFASIGFTVEKMSGEKIVYGNKKPSVIGFILGQQLATRLKIEQTHPQWIKSEDGVNYTYSEIVFTSPLLIRKGVWRKAGGMDEQNFPFSDSDTDLCMKFLEMNYKNVVIKCEGVVHDNRNHASKWSAQRVYNYHQARYRLLAKHAPSSKWIMRFLLPLRHGLELVLGFLLNKPTDYIGNRKKMLLSAWGGYNH